MNRETSYTAAMWLEGLAGEVGIKLGFWAPIAILAFPPLLVRARASPNTAVVQ